MKRIKKIIPGAELKLPAKVAIIHSDVKREYFPTEESYITEKDAVKYAGIIADYLTKLKVEPVLVPGNTELPEKIKEIKPDMVINLVDSLKGSEYLTSTIPAILELLEIPYTGAGILGHSLSTNKYLIQKLLQQSGIPTPDSQLFNSPNDYLDPTIRFPLISKLNETHGSVEITSDSVSENEKHLRERLKYLITTYRQPVLVEEFIVGREVSALLLEGLNKKVYIGERLFEEETKFKLISFQMKWEEEDAGKLHYQKYEDPILREYVRKAFVLSRMADYGRFDVKIDSSGRYFFIDANCNPFLGPSSIGSTLGQISQLYGLEFDEVLRRILINTMYLPTQDAPVVEID